MGKSTSWYVLKDFLHIWLFDIIWLIGSEYFLSGEWYDSYMLWFFLNVLEMARKWMERREAGGFAAGPFLGDTTWYLWSNKCDDTSMMGEKQSQKGKEFHSILTTRTFQGVPLSNPLRNVCHLAPKLEGPLIKGWFCKKSHVFELVAPDGSPQRASVVNESLNEL